MYPPSHSSNYTSGLDVGINGPLKKQSKTDITLWEAYLRKQSRSLRIEDFPHVVAGAISKAVKESSIVDCYKQYSTWPIDPDIVLNKMTISASNQRLTFAEYTTKHSVPAPVPEAQSDLPLENVIATSPQIHTQHRRSSSEPRSNREPGHIAQTCENMNTVRFKLGHVFDLEAERVAVRNTQLLVQTGIELPKKGSRGTRLDTNISGVYDVTGLKKRKLALAAKQKDDQTSKENLKKAKLIRAGEEKEKLRCVQEETKLAHQEKKSTLKLMKASKELYITEQKKLKKLTQKNAKLVEKVQALKAQNRRLKGNAKQKVIAEKQNKNCISTCKVKNPSEWVLCGGKSCPAGNNWYHIECSGTCMDAVKVLTADWFCDACLDGSTIESEETDEAEDSVDIAEGDSSEQDGYRSDVDGDSNAPEVDGAKDADSEDENEENLNESDEDSNCGLIIN